jgi:hypothetical protein
VFLGPKIYKLKLIVSTNSEKFCYLPVHEKDILARAATSRGTLGTEQTRDVPVKEKKS